MKTSMWTWALGVLLIVLLYIGGPILFANQVKPLVLGMPFLIFWFVLIPLLNPVILGVVYQVDRKYNPQQDAFEEEIT